MNTTRTLAPSGLDLFDASTKPDVDAVWDDSLGRWTQGRNRPVYVLRGRKMVSTFDLDPYRP